MPRYTDLHGRAQSSTVRWLAAGLVAWLAACGTSPAPPAPRPPNDGSAWPVSAGPTRLRVAVPSPLHPGALFLATEQLTKALAEAGAAVTRVDGERSPHACFNRWSTWLSVSRSNKLCMLLASVSSAPS